MRVKNILKSHKGFTLVELVVVIAILCILATMAFLKFDDNLQAARGAKLIADMRTIESASAIYYARNNAWPVIVASNSGIDDQTPNHDFTTNYFKGGWPLPPVGKFIIQGTNGHRYTYQFTTQKYFSYYGVRGGLASEGRTTCDFKTIDDFMTGGTGTGLNNRHGSGPIAVD